MRLFCCVFGWPHAPTPRRHEQEGRGEKRRGQHERKPKGEAGLRRYSHGIENEDEGYEREYEGDDVAPEDDGTEVFEWATHNQAHNDDYRICAE